LSAGSADTSMAAVMRMALARLQLDAAQTESAQASAFVRRNPAPATFSVPPSEDYLKELHAFWRDTRAFSHSMSDARTLAAMQNVAQQAQVEPSLQSLSDASLQAFALMSRELGRAMSTLVQTRHQVWLVQSPLTETCRRVLRAVPVEPGELFGSAALEALEGAARARQTRQQLSGLHRSVSAPSRPGGPSAIPQRRSQPPDHSGGLRRSQRPAQQMAFGPPNAYLPGSLVPHKPTGAPPEPQEAGGAGTRPIGPVVSWFSHQQLSYWAACTSDPWAVSTLTQGYELQFRLRPPAFSRSSTTRQRP
ncbi:unnamed protein product, partial [Boreogadus saida]